MSAFQMAGDSQAIALTETGHMEITHIYKKMTKKFSRLLVGFSAAQIIIGILCIIIHGVTLGMVLHGSYMLIIPKFGHGFLTGLTFIVTGAIGVAAGKGKKKSLIVSFNVLSIISASLCSYSFILSTFSVFIAGQLCYYDFSGCRSEAALETVLVILAFMEVGCAIGASVVCCTIGACCCDCDCGCCCPPTVLRETFDRSVQRNQKDKEDIKYNSAMK